MDISLLKSVTKICVHDNCPDGTASAIILKEALNLDPEQIVFAQYQSSEYKEMKAEAGLLFCDCTPPFDRIQEFVDAGTIVLDHHKEARDIVAAFGERGVFADKKTEPTVSGAGLAYREAWQPMLGKLTCFSRSFAEEFSLLAGVRDNWQLENPLWKKAREHAAILMFFSNEMWKGIWLSQLASQWDDKYGWLGKILVDKDNERAASIAEKRWTYRTDSGLVIAIVPSRFISDVSDRLEDECELVIGFSYTKNDPGCYPGLLLSLRSFGNSFDCGKFCKSYGGGGHLNAAGCKLETTDTTLNPYKLLCEKFDEYLSKG
jgi:oligoribonuclease NrnB/cAMP/cGMP phosphodiesterase (DHH superfamily)